MGREVAHLPGRARVDDPGDCGGEGFGRWFARERTLRQISVEFVSARTKLATARLRALEAEEQCLGHDGQGRAAARALARAIGADPDEAVRRLPSDGGGRAPRERPAGVLRPRPRLASGLAALGGVALLLLAAWGLARWAERSSPEQATPEVVYRPDYLKRLLGPER